MITIFSAVRVYVWPLAAVMLLAASAATGQTPATTPEAPATVPAATQPVAPIAAGEVPPAGGFKAMPKPGDDGSAIIVEWARPSGEKQDPENKTRYVLEMAAKPEDFGNEDKVRTKDILIAPAKAGNMYRTEIIASSDQFFPPPEKRAFTPVKLQELGDAKALTPKVKAGFREVAKELKGLADEKIITAEEYGKATKFLAVTEDSVGKPPAAAEAATTSPVTSRPATHPIGSRPSTTAATGSMPTSAAAPTLTDDDKAWLGALAAYVVERDWLRTFVPPAGEYLTQDDLNRALAAAGMEFRGDKSENARIERDWYGRLMTFLKAKDQKRDKEKKREINTSTWYFRLAVQRGDQKMYVAQNDQPLVISAAGHPHWFRWGKLNNLIFALVFCAIVLAFIQIAKRRGDLFIRKIGGLEAVDEAIGRSTEMDKPVHFVHGLGGVSDLATMAAINILGRVSTRSAEHDTRIKVMNYDPLVTAVSQEVVQQGYRQAGRPDAYSPDDVSMVASDQFSYVAAVSGRMVREQPGAIFILGYFAAESLLLAETGASTGAIQVAGTDAFTQLPFFITTCDYTLIGEELYAASAYLSREPKLLGSLRGQDVGKAFLMVTIVLVSILLTIAAAAGWDWDWLMRIFTAGME